MATAKLGYALSGGGARAFAHLGILKVLQENGIQPDYICGTSMGAVIGALYAQGYDISSIQDMLIKVKWQDVLDDSFKRKELYIGQKRWAPYSAFSFAIDDDWKLKLPSSVWGGSKLNLELAKLFASSGSELDFSELPIPFSCVATDLLTGEKVVFESGSLLQSLRASLSIPSLLEPFEFDGHLYIDGGVSQNLPTTEEKAMGADYVIGIKANSHLRPKRELKHFVTVFDQTLNINMINNLNRSLDDCDLLLEPDLEGFSASDYSKVASIIEQGEAYARAHWDEIIEHLEAFDFAFKEIPKPIKAGKKPLRSMEVEGNVHLSFAKIKEYLGLKLGEKYSSSQLVEACDKAWNSQLFHSIYPLIDEKEDGYHLKIKIKEKERRELFILLSYTSEEGVQAGGIFKMQNVLLKNSIFQAGINLGGENEYNLDYVKNFGELWGSYFRIFQYMKEQRRYYYDTDLYKTASVKAREVGVNAGVGVFASKLIVAEGFLYGYRTKLFRDISTVAGVDSLYLISGAGLKFYHESLDDYYFPMSGLRASLKFNFARSTDLSDYIYSKAQGSAELYTPISDWLSLKLRLDMGSWFDRQYVNVDPFYLGGAGAFMGYQKYQVSVPEYKMWDLGLTATPKRKFYLFAGAQAGIFEQIDDQNDTKPIWSGYVGVGVSTILGPARLSYALREGGNSLLYLNLGYDLDIFHFSRN